ncbi:hypothetical protein [Sphingobium sp. D43FB]|uniref:hypothetical protein n=1 Tax=Sphingobium sp. D43FB TaxID=2017595 RepID=UPI0020D0E3B9|nr:hypothetical protein [Sphingobium sp. D43FB]
MAFIDFAQPMAGAPLSACLAMPDTTETATLGPLEWQVVALAQSDRLSTLRRAGSWDTWSALIFGPRPSPVLASERLEALRRLSVEA